MEFCFKELPVLASGFTVVILMKSTPKFISRICKVGIPVLGSWFTVVILLKEYTKSCFKNIQDCNSCSSKLVFGYHSSGEYKFCFKHWQLTPAR